MIIISNKNIPGQALKRLKDFGKVLTFETSDITYPAISCHPDVFICMSDDKLIIAPNTPEKFKLELNNNKVQFVEGQKNVGGKYPGSSIYNAVITQEYLIHNIEITDSSIKEACVNKKKIHVEQGYTRCNLLPLNNSNFITSDGGIYKTLIANNLNVLYINPQEILLPGFKNGFFGGVCGVYQNRIFITGSLNKFADSKQIHTFLTENRYESIELYNGPLFDCGSLIFID
jgi:hypothetical protein